MNVKKIKRKCAVKGCKNVETYTISKVRDFGDTVLICEPCLKEALDAIKNYGKEKPKTEAATPPAVFYNHLISPPGAVNPDKPPKNTSEEFICPKCGREFKTKLGLANHEKACKNKITEPLKGHPDPVGEPSLSSLSVEPGVLSNDGGESS